MGLATSPQHVAVASIEDQNATHKRAGMTISPQRIGLELIINQITFEGRRGSTSYFCRDTDE
jgi:hypothetical protein